MTPRAEKGTNVRIGTCGWNYDAWLGPLFPAGTKAAQYLATYARAFSTVEVDSTFYATPSAKTVRGWASRVGADFRFALKLPQEITHENRLRNSGTLLTAFVEVVRELGVMLGPILLQLGPDFGPSELPALAAFLPLLPADMQFAVEFRQRTWIHEGVLALLAEHNVALALVEGPWIPRRTMLALADRPIANFAYVRWMGPNRDLVDHSRIQVDRTREIEAWEPVLRAVAGRVADVYGYVSNHFAGHAPGTARMIQRALGQPPVDPDSLGEQLGLF